MCVRMQTSTVDCGLYKYFGKLQNTSLVEESLQIHSDGKHYHRTPYPGPDDSGFFSGLCQNGDQLSADVGDLQDYGRVSAGADQDP